MPANRASERPLDARVRERLRALRLEQGLTLQQVAEAANIDLSTLSRLESGKRRLALDHIPFLADALGVSSDELLRSARPSDPRVRQPPRCFDGLTVWPLTNHGHGGGLHAYKVHVAARRRTPPATMEVHDGHDWLYVISGRLRLLLGEDNHLLEPGEAAEFTTWTPHWFGAVDGPADFILVVGPQGERTHLEHQSRHSPGPSEQK
ncbi:MAG TPA: XRE family transcriptional regulator [Actinomycetota bacterium]|nr:XRE family transcriptional regulator [Actinomycetota bacterium]